MFSDQLKIIINKWVKDNQCLANKEILLLAHIIEIVHYESEDERNKVSEYYINQFKLKRADLFKNKPS